MYILVALLFINVIDHFINEKFHSITEKKKKKKNIYIYIYIYICIYIKFSSVCYIKFIVLQTTWWFHKPQRRPPGGVIK